MAAMLENFFKAKKRYWYILAINENIDPRFPIPAKTKAIVCDRSLKLIISTIKVLQGSIGGKDSEIEFVIIKTSQYTHPSGVVDTEHIAHIIASSSQTWNLVKFYLRGTLKRESISMQELSLIEDFTKNTSN